MSDEQNRRVKFYSHHKAVRPARPRSHQGKATMPADERERRLAELADQHRAWVEAHRDGRAPQQLS